MATDTRNWKLGAALAGGAVVGLGIAWVLREKATPEPDYRLLASENGLEIRAYSAFRVAETVVAGERKSALNDGYRLLSGYLSGARLPMRVPVLQEGERDAEGWRVRLTMPDDRDLPEPPEGVELVDVPARRVGVVTFHGTANDDRLNEAEARLRGWLERLGETADTGAEYAFYNSPMVLPALRRNEVVIPLG